MVSARPATNAPMRPMALPSVPIRTSASTPAARQSPRPWGPSTPRAWASSTSNPAWYSSASARSARSGASVASIENRASVTTRAARWPARYCWSASRTAWASRWGVTTTRAPESRHPSISEAWLSASEMTKSPGPTKAGSAPRLAR